MISNTIWTRCFIPYRLISTARKKSREILEEHPEVKFVSLVGIDVGGHDTDEKIPVEEFFEGYG